MMDNIFIRSDLADNIKANKEKSTKKDGAVATIMVLDQAIRCGNDTSASVYDSRAFCLYNPRIFFLNSAILIRELSLTRLIFPLFYAIF